MENNEHDLIYVRVENYEMAHQMALAGDPCRTTAAFLRIQSNNENPNEEQAQEIKSYEQMASVFERDAKIRYFVFTKLHDPPEYFYSRSIETAFLIYKSSLPLRDEASSIRKHFIGSKQDLPQKTTAESNPLDKADMLDEKADLVEAWTYKLCRIKDLDKRIEDKSGIPISKLHKRNLNLIPDFSLGETLVDIELWLYEKIEMIKAELQSILITGEIQSGVANLPSAATYYKQILNNLNDTLDIFTGYKPSWYLF